MSKKFDAVLMEAQERFARCEDWESDCRKHFLEDYKFANADANNGWQWPESIKKDRDLNNRPCLTINKVRQHNLQIINDAKQNKPSVSVRATGGGASYQSAQVLAGIIRHIEYQSNAGAAYMRANKFQVEAGIGYLRVETDYIDDTSFDQEIFISGVKDPLSVYMDPDAKEEDKSDAKFVFVFDDIEHEEFNKIYPEYKDIGTNSVLDTTGKWLTKQYVRVAEYFRKVEIKDELFVYNDEAGRQVSITAAQLKDKDLIENVRGKPGIKARDIKRTVVEWYLIIGDQVVEKREWAGKYIPIIPIIGEETIIEGRLDRKGHTRALKDPQRMYNYWSSSAVEAIGLQGKTPWIASAEAIEGFESYWNTANRVNHSVLPYNAVGDSGEPLAPPQRPAPPQMPPAYMQAMDVAQNEMMMASGQYQAQMGAPGNERSGKAINERQRQGDNATYHYIDNLGNGIRFLGKILVDLIPKIYDTRRVVMIMAEDGTDSEVQIDPQAKQAYAEQMQKELGAVQRIFNPNVGKYEVEADIGPAYGTRRQEAFNAFTQIITQAPALTSVVGDILLRAADFPMADEAAERLKRMVPAQAMGNGPGPQEQKLMEALQKTQKELGDTQQKLAREQLQNHNKEVKHQIDMYDAETKRLDVVNEQITDQGQLKALIGQTLVEILQNSLAGPVSPVRPPSAQMTLPLGYPPGQPPGIPPVEGAMQTREGRWVYGDPTRGGHRMMVG